MPETPPTGTVSKSLEAAESANIAHGRVEGYAAQRLRLEPSKRILESAQGDKSLQGSIVDHQLLSLYSVPRDAIAAYHNTPPKPLPLYECKRMYIMEWLNLCISVKFIIKLSY